MESDIGCETTELVQREKGIKDREIAMNDLPVVSLMIATFNSYKILQKTLAAIEGQTYPKEKLEIIIVDGGSTDQTLELAKAYGCVIYNNPKTEPVNAKLIGFNKAKGKYLITIDHDEVIENPDSILNKVNAAEKHPECKAVLCSGYKRPKDYPGLNQYISEFGDPFSLFIYNFSKDYQFLHKVLRKYYTVTEETQNYIIVSFANMKKAPIFELCCLGTMINKEYFKDFPHVQEDGAALVHLFYEMLEKGDKSIILMKNDPLTHYSVDSLKAYLPKLKWRICNNVHFAEKGEMGFSGRTKYQKGVALKKYLFIPYALTLIIPFVQGVGMAVSRRNSVYLLHPILSFYVAVQILYQYGLKVLGKTPEFTSYDGKKKIKR